MFSYAGGVAFARIDVVQGWSGPAKDGLLEGVRHALVTSLRVPADDPTVMLTEHHVSEFLRPRQMSARYVVVTVTMFSGRSLDAKRALYAAITEAVVGAGALREEVDVVVLEPPRENWARAGVASSDVELDFEVDI